jgi:hypothetical protein
LILLTLFTPLTFILALTNPVSDCGCFGDAIHLTNWQTFGKNILLFTGAILLFIQRDSFKYLFKNFQEWFIMSGAIFIMILFTLYNLRYLPIIDFLPYKTGVKIAEKMTIPDGVAVDQYKTTFIYEKGAVRKEFSISNYPANDTTWKFVDQKSVLVKKGYQPPIHDFSITSMNGDDITQNILTNSGYSLLMISKKLKEADPENLSEGFKLGNLCNSKGISFYILTSSGKEEIKDYNNSLNFNSADETTLKTMVRANPGYVLLKDGTILAKWSWANIPGTDWFERLISGKGNFK